MEPPITGTVWKWQVTQFSDDRRIAVPAPERYTIQFGEDGRLSVRADCNLGVGAYRREGGRIDIGPLALTRAACPADSLDGPFLAQLERVTGVTRDGDQLVLLLSFDSGAMIFVP